MKKVIFRFGIVYTALLFIFSFLLILVNFIPSSAIRDNVIESAQILQKEGMYPQYNGYRLSRLDNFTDAIMLNIAVSVESEHPINSAMSNYYYDDIKDIDIERAILTERTAKNDVLGLEKSRYGRYWQGYQVTLRPILCFLNINGIRILNYILLSLLVIVNLFLIWTKIGKFESILFFISLLIVFFPVVPSSMQYSTCFYLMLIGMAAVLIFPQLTQNTTRVLVTFFCFGAFTTYMDFLTTPQLTLGMPLVVAFLANRPKNPWKWVILACIAWILGYGLLWVSKWGIGTLLTGYNFFNDATTQVGLRTSHEYKLMELTIPRMLQYLISDNEWYLSRRHLYFVAIVILIYLFLQKGFKAQKKYGWLFLIALIVPTWFLVIRQHSIEHRWFTMRSFLISLYAGILWVYYTIQKQTNQ